MPCCGWSIPATSCKVGSRLAAVKGSVCSGCYARKGRYVFPNVQSALQRRLAAFLSDPQAWEDSMVEALSGESYFRWFDSGDLQGPEMLARIVSIARRLPATRFWLPTKEAFLVTQWKRTNGEFPTNLTVRVSLPMPEMFRVGTSSLHFASVSKDPAKVTCPSSQQGNRCGDCRTCWEPKDVVYKAH